jgi:hypothetical protein
MPANGGCSRRTLLFEQPLRVLQQLLVTLPLPLPLPLLLLLLLLPPPLSLLLPVPPSPQNRRHLELVSRPRTISENNVPGAAEGARLRADLVGVGV